MDDVQIDSLAKSLPKGHRIHWVPADLEGPAHIVFYLPDIYRFEVIVRKKLGIFPVWESFAYFEQCWPANAENQIHLTNGAYKETLEKAINKAGLNITVLLEDSNQKEA